MSNTLLPHDHGPNLQEVLDTMPYDSTFYGAADVFSQLSDATRLRILWILCNSEECVTNIAAAVGMSDPAVSHHLRVLRRNSIITSRRLGKEVHYSLSNTELALLVREMVEKVFELSEPPEEDDLEE